MHPANTALSTIDLGTPALRWPEMERVTISLASPDEGGAVAYYFDTLCPAHTVDGLTDLAGKVGLPGKAACDYLMNLVHSKGLELVRGPFLTVAPEHGPLPDGWWMIRALVWVEEFDLLVPDGLETATVRINGRAYELALAGRQLDYAKVCELAGVPLFATVTYRNAAERGRGEGTLAIGQSVRVKTSGTVFDAAVTSGA